MGGHCGDLICKCLMSDQTAIIIIMSCTQLAGVQLANDLVNIVTFLSHNLVVLFSDFSSGLDVKGVSSID